ncbi:phosphotransferase [Thalassobius sp. Cn5-15]|uniref:aminoglycoside phosphotransferase family protein n=1 Tax=Thalassobius sp. Cn5-15 TaxID=2917763 RepID=UPI001EF2CC21|nr:phosphotransferase [Thalassobius sp. Cn5-15]
MTRSITAFLAATDWANATRSQLAGDASNRRYERLHMGNNTAVLMDAPPDRGEDVRPFIQIARRLSTLGLSAPEILAEDIENGFLLLEDFGDALLARLVAEDPAAQIPLYTAATDVLITLHQSPAPKEIEAFTPAVMTDLITPLWNWYMGQGTAHRDLAHRFSILFLPILQQYANDTSVMILRDYHAENLIHLPDRSGAAQMGLLDFQDAKAGHRAYDLVSLLQDARRDVAPEIEAQIINHYLSETGIERDSFTAAYATLGLQRNLRILGVLTRLCLHADKAHYVDFLPRVWGYVLRDLDHSALAPLAPFLFEHLPAPTPEYCTTLKAKAGTCPTP